MAKKKEKKKRVIPVPQTSGDVAESIARISELQRKVRAENDALGEEIQGLQRDAMAIVKPLTSEIADRVSGIWTYATSNEADLTDGGKRRSFEVPTGVFGWRKHPPAVKIANNDKVLEELKRLALTRFIRTVEEPDKQAMLKEQDIATSVKGVKIAQAETFFVKPSVTDVEIEEPLASLREEWEE